MREIEERLVRIARSELASVREEAASWGAARLLLNVHAELELGVAHAAAFEAGGDQRAAGAFDHARADQQSHGAVARIAHPAAVVHGVADGLGGGRLGCRDICRLP